VVAGGAGYTTNAGVGFLAIHCTMAEVMPGGLGGPGTAARSPSMGSGVRLPGDNNKTLICRNNSGHEPPRSAAMVRTTA